MSKIYQDDVGTVFEVDVGDDLSSATTTDLKVRKPDGTTTTWTGTKDGVVNSQINYTIVEDDLDQVGEYLLQAYVVTPTWTGRGETAAFVVSSSFG